MRIPGWYLPIRRFLAATLVAVGLAPSVALAENFKWEFFDSVERWNIYALIDPTSGQLASCLCAAEYQSEITLSAVVSSDFEFTMMMGKESWNIASDDEFEVLLRVDSNPIMPAVGWSSSPQAVGFQPQDEASMFEQLRRGNVLYVRGNRADFEFALNDTSQSFERLIECVKHHLTPNMADPFSDGGQGQGQGSARNPFQ